MGREIYAQIRDTDAYDEETEGYGLANSHVAWDSTEGSLNLFVCGRDDATGYIAAQANEDGFVALVGDEVKDILDAVKEYSHEDHREISKVRKRLKAIEAARKNARNYEEFASFDEEIDNCREWLEHESYSRADGLLEIIGAVLGEYSKEKYDKTKYKPYLVVSE